MVTEIDSERQRQARRYSYQRRILLAAQLAVTVIYLVLLIATGAATDLRNALLGAPGGRLGLVAAYGVVLLLAYAVLSFPLSVVGGWSLPRRYGLSVQTFTQWFADWLKGEAIGLIVGLVMLEVVYALLQFVPQLWWAIAAALYVVFVAGLAHVGPILLLPLFFKVTPLESSDLTERLKDLARQAGTRVEGVYRLHLSAKTTAANAALTGLGSTRRIVLGDTLLEHYSPDEIEVVFAHELGHHVHRDIPRMIAEQALVTLVALYVAHLALDAGAQRLGYAGIADVATMPLLALVLGTVGVISTPLVNWLSRRAERSADCYALQVTGNPAAFISMMIRLANQNLAVYRPARWVEILLYDHPSIAERVELAEHFRGQGCRS